MHKRNVPSFHGFKAHACVLRIALLSVDQQERHTLARQILLDGGRCLYRTGEVNQQQDRRLMKSAFVSCMAPQFKSTQPGAAPTTGCNLPRPSMPGEYLDAAIHVDQWGLVSMDST